MVLGYFVFENIGDGCLVAKYGNWNSRSPIPECAKRRKEPYSEGFEGEYVSIWIEDVSEPWGDSDPVILNIRQKAGSTGVFTLEWSGGATFHGEGMLPGKLLVGAYWDNDIHGPTVSLTRK